MDITLIYIIGALLGVSAISLIGLALLSMHQTIVNKLVPWLVAFAAGALLAVAFFDLLPESFEMLGVPVAPMWIVGGILIFLLLENLLCLRHAHHDKSEESHFHTTGYAVLVGDGLHNFLDGVLIASAFMVSIPVGISVTLAVVLHEIPQEVGDFAILLHSGFTRAKALWFNFLSALTALVGGLATFFALNAVESMVPYLIAIGGGGFLYIALVDIIGSFKHTGNLRINLGRMLAVVLGLVVIGGVAFLFPHE